MKEGKKIEGGIKGRELEETGASKKRGGGLRREKKGSASTKPRASERRRKKVGSLRARNRRRSHLRLRKEFASRAGAEGVSHLGGAKHTDRGEFLNLWREGRKGEKGRG